MNLPEAFRFAWRGISANKARSALTMLGVMIGVSAVIILVAVGTGASRSVTDAFDSLGTNTLTISPGSGSGFFGLGGAGAGQSGNADQAGSATETRFAELTMEDAEALSDPRLAPDVAHVAPVVDARSVVATLKDNSHDVGSTVGTTPDYLAINNDSVVLGRAFTDSDVLAHSRVLLVGPTVAEALGGGDQEGVLNQVVRLNGKEFTVIGLLDEKGSSGIQDLDDRIVAPITAVQDHLFGYGNLSSISAQATSAESVDAAQAQVESILDARHRTTADDRDFSIMNSATFLGAASTVTGVFTVLLGAIAAISLLVGGIGVMNIMLVTVTERTREIGIRKAIGAQRADIIGQFMLEALLLSILGGLAGIAFGYLVTRIEVSGFRALMSASSVAMAFGFAVAVGLFFGIYPAVRAANLRPIEALRYE